MGAALAQQDTQNLPPKAQAAQTAAGQLAQQQRPMGAALAQLQITGGED